MSRTFARHRYAPLGLLLFAACILLLLVAPAAQAQGVSSGELLPGEIGTTIGTGTQDIRITIARIVRVAFGILGTVALLLILYAGFLWMTAAGSEERVTQAKKTMVAAAIGLAIMLSAFTITSFILNALIAATTEGGVSGPGGGGGPGGDGFGTAGGAFRPTAIQPSGTLAKYDVVASVTFSSAPTGDVGNIKSNLLLERLAGGTRTAVEYDPVVQNNTIRLVPLQPCPAPNEDRRCLEPNADYAVTVRAGLKNASTSDPRTVNCGISAVCSQTFKTGEAVATEPPTVRISSPEAGQSLPAGDIAQVQSLLTDPNGIGAVEYFADGAFFTADGDPQSIAPGTWRSQVGWDTAAFTPVRNVTLKARVTNIDGDQVESEGVLVTLRPAHCFNNVKDADEVGKDCGGDDCGTCVGGSCTTASECASGQCEGGRCVENPVITSVSPADGRPGTLVTVRGRSFGGTAGKVTFLGGPDEGDETEAPLGQCLDAWTDVQVVVVVPAEAKSGPIRLTTVLNRTDATNDGNGGILDDFLVNDVTRPGICSVSPKSIKTGRVLTVVGNGFGAVQGGSRVQFARAGADCVQVQPWNGSAEAAQADPWTETSIQPTVPNVEAGPDGTNYLVRAVVADVGSNDACIRIEPPEAGTEPRIDYLTPEDGSVGTYLTIFGANFGSGGTVRFRSGLGEAVGDVSFPQQCSTGYWKADSVTVKVPATFLEPPGAIQLGRYEVLVKRNDGRESNAKAFEINTEPVPPGVCRIDPDNGPVGLGVTLYGENFGDVAASGLPTYLAQHPDAVTFHEGIGVTTLSAWRKTSIATAVPSGAKTGPVRVRSYATAAPADSNGVNFRVQDCREEGGDGVCGQGLTCCGDGACRAACGEEGKKGGFAWQFSTGPIPVFPVVIQDATCQTASMPTIMPSPNPYKGAQEVCTNIEFVTVRFSLPMDAGTFTSGNVLFESCAGDERISSTCSPVANVGAPALISYDADGRSMLKLRVEGLAPMTWYRLTVRDQVRSQGVPERSSQQLDGDFDGRGGGNYLTTFKTGATPCLVAAVDVQPGTGKITAANQTLPYTAFPLSASCVILSCSGRTVAWSSSDSAKATITGQGAPRQCEADAAPVSETDPGPPIKIRVQVDDKRDEGDLIVDYANPAVVKYAPRDCTEACLNTVVYAYFNTPMATEGPGSVLTNVRLQRCRNESCVSYDGDVALSPTYDARSLMLRFNNPDLSPNTFYRATVKGTAESVSAAPLTGLNFEDRDFSWIFRTRTDANPCGPQKVTIDPPQTTLRYIGQRGAVTALPFSSPDKCSSDGQLLNALSFDWGWTKAQTPANPVAFSFVPGDPPNHLKTNPRLPTGCSTNCLMTGSKPPGTPSCGNGKLEKGEACDTPGVAGCNDSCLLTGNSQASGCGDGTLQQDRGEECDEGVKNGQEGSGCTASCQLTGSLPGVSQCGNGSVGVGEACDDDNTSSGDGCGPACLLEGSARNVFVCGNGVLEPGEQCDYELASPTVASRLLLPGKDPLALGAGDERNPSRPDFACTSSCLLKGNQRGCTDGVGCCGNGVIEPIEGEGCDAGPDNGKPVSGCSSSCTRTGSNPELGAFCGDGGAPFVKAIDPVTDVQNGGGEDCEATASDGKADPLQVVEGKNRCDAGNSCTASVSAAIGTVSGQGKVSVECSCRTDSDCSVFAATLACGAGACCYPRPGLPDIEPKGADECRNVLISILFGEEMDEGSLTGNISVESCTAVASKEDKGWFARAVSAVGRFLRSLAGVGADAADTCAPVVGDFTHVVRTSADGSKRTYTTFVPKQLLDENKAYKVVVRGGAAGAKSLKGVGYAEGQNPTQTFSTGDDICTFDVLQVSPSTELIQSADIMLTLTAVPMTDRTGQLEPISPIPGVYDWTYSWSTVPESGAATGILELTSSGPTATIQAKKAQNGHEQVVAKAVIITDTVLSPSTVGAVRVGKSDTTVLLCQNPWPRRDPATGTWQPYVDSQTHFSLAYCRDTQGAPLPELEPTPVLGQSGFGGGLLRFCRTTRDGEQPKACFTDTDCAAGDRCQSMDLFFRFAPEWGLRDVIGVRAYANEDLLTPEAWYRAQRFSGSTQGLAVDGYQALRDGRTVYVGAVDKYGDPELRPYVYVFAHSDKSDKRTVDIFDQIVKNLRFNLNIAPLDRVVNVCKDGTGQVVAAGQAATTSCTSDLDCYGAFSEAPAGLHCDADKDKIRRDMRRWQDLRRLQEALEDVRSDTGFYPRLESGSFVRGFTTSKWPSWGQQMGAAASIVDPLNAFNHCEAFGSECVVTRTACKLDSDCDGNVTGDVCRPRFEATTCYNNAAGIFMCPEDSHVFQYRSIGGTDYRMAADFEYTAYPWAGSDCSERFFEEACQEGIGCAWVSTGVGVGVCERRITIAPVCGGLASDAGFKCLATGAPCEDSSQCAAEDHCVPDNVPLFGPGVGANCGNGLLEADEECEVGQERDVACLTGGVSIERCTSACLWKEAQACPGAAQCGNGSIEAHQGETCDDGAQNGQYGRCRTGDLGCKKRCVNITPRERYVLGDVSLETCASNADCAAIMGASSVCTDRMNFCGDGVRQSGEACDDGAQNGQYGKCAWDCRGAGPRCGDDEINGGEICDGNQEDSTGVCVPTSSVVSDTGPLDGAAADCAKDADCAEGQRCALCAPTSGGIPQTRVKSCKPANAPPPTACTFDDWSACKPAGACGNGKVEGAEECDAGTANSETGACLPTCKNNVCNDGFLRSGVEQCDNGASNGVLCSPEYGLTCNYCRNDCTIETVSGAFCGDRFISAPPESCDPGPVAAWCSRTYPDLGNPAAVVGCRNDNDCAAGTCRNYPNASFAAARPASRLGRLLYGVPDFVRHALVAPLAYAPTLNQLASFRLAVMGDGGGGGGGGDLTSPGLAWVAPAAGTTLTGVVTLTAKAVDSSTPITVWMTASSPCAKPTPVSQNVASNVNVNFSWDTRTCTNGTRTVTFYATDAVGNSSVPITRSFNINNPPPPPPPDTAAPVIGSVSASPSAPYNTQTVSMSVSGVTDASNITKIEIFLTPGAGTKTLLKTCSAGIKVMSVTSCSVSGGPYGNNTYTITAEATDAAGNKGSKTATFTVTDPPRYVTTGTGEAYKDFFEAAEGYFIWTPGGSPPPEGASCHSSAECAPSQYCHGGQGQCIAFNTQCVPEPYSNTRAAAGSDRYFDGSCSSCNSLCAGSVSKSPNFCGDTLTQAQFGEECDGAGDPNAVGQGSTYKCGVDCAYDPNGGYCGDNIKQTAEGEVCDVNTGNARVTNGVITGRIMDAVFASPVGHAYTGGNLGIKVELYEGNRKIDDARTDNNGVYTFSGLNVLNTCKIQKYKVKVVSDGETYKNRQAIGSKAAGTITFTDLGYFAKESDQFGFSCADTDSVKAMSANRIELEDIFVVRKLGDYEYLVLVEWEGGLGGNYMDLHLRHPNQKRDDDSDGNLTESNDYNENQGTFWNKQGKLPLTDSPHSYLSCYHTDGTENCGTFDTKPEVIRFKFANPDTDDPYYSSGENWVAWLTDWQCGGGTDAEKDTKVKSSCKRFSSNTQTLFVNKKTKVTVYKWDFGLYKTYTPSTSPAGGYWKLFTMNPTGTTFTDSNAIQSTMP